MMKGEVVTIVQGNGQRARVMAKSEPWIDEVLRFWFVQLQPQAWFRKDRSVDEKIRARFGDLHESFSHSVPRTVTATATGALAGVIVLDQFPRNMYRRSPRAFQTDALALAVAEQAIGAAFDQQLNEQQRLFLYMPFQHSEDRAAQARSVELFTGLAKIPGHSKDSTEALRSAQQHKAIIDRFGRFPHRNAALGRASTAEELEFLKEHPGF
jgi:uncharacterized protein (DUF924 family)